MDAVPVKGNELDAIRRLLDELDVTDALITIDAIDCQHDVAEQVLEAGGDYVLHVKGNQPTLLQELEDNKRQGKETTEMSYYISSIDREFGYRTLPKQFENGNVQKSIIQSSMIPTKESTPIVQVTGSVLDAAENLLSEVGKVTTLQTHGADYAEIAWQRRLRNRAGKKKKRGRGI